MRSVQEERYSGHILCSLIQLNLPFRPDEGISDRNNYLLKQFPCTLLERTGADYCGPERGQIRPFLFPMRDSSSRAGTISRVFVPNEELQVPRVMPEHRETALGKMTADSMIFAHKMLVTTDFPQTKNAIVSDKS